MKGFFLVKRLRFESELELHRFFSVSTAAWIVVNGEFLQINGEFCRQF